MRHEGRRGCQSQNTTLSLRLRNVPPFANPVAHSRNTQDKIRKGNVRSLRIGAWKHRPTGTARRPTLNTPLGEILSVNMLRSDVNYVPTGYTTS